MTQAIQHYQFNSAQIRVIVKDNEPWWVAKDVCTALELSDVSVSLARLDEDEKGTSSTCTLGGEQMVMTVNESGLYNLVLGSRKPEAKAFKRWVTHEVLPAIRRNGAYAIMEQEKIGLPQLATWNGLPDLLDSVEPVTIKLELDKEDAKHLRLRLVEFVTGVVFTDTLPSYRRTGIVDTAFTHIKRRIHQLVTEAGAKGIAKTELHRHTQGVQADTRNKLIQELQNAGLIAVIEGQGGRIGRLYPPHAVPTNG